jgi:RelE toxin of RelE / RelB toxin-antitoxin system
MAYTRLHGPSKRRGREKTEGPSMFNAGSYLITIAEMDQFTGDAENIFTETEYEELILFLAEYPDAGEIIPGTGGVRKVRWRARGQGKRGGARVVYYFRDLNVPVYLLAVYAKGEKLNLTEAEKKTMARIVDALVDSAMAKRLRVITRA